MPSLSIRARLIFLSVLLLAILALSSALLIRELARVSQSLAEEATLVSVVKNANSASKHFGDLKYWVMDAAVTQLARSQQAADTAKAALNSDLTAISTVDPAFVAAIGREVGAMTDLARQAGVAYSSDDSASGNALLEQAKSHVLTIDGEIDRVVDRVRAAGPGQARRVDARSGTRRQARGRGRSRSSCACIGLHCIHRALDYRPLETARAEHGVDHPGRSRRRDAAHRGP